jgi:hypothetical protein
MKFKIGDLVYLFSTENHSFPIYDKEGNNFVRRRTQAITIPPTRYYFNVEKNTKVFGVVVHQLQEYIETDYDKEGLEDFLIVMFCNPTGITFAIIHKNSHVLSLADPENKIVIYGA